MLSKKDEIEEIHKSYDKGFTSLIEHMTLCYPNVTLNFEEGAALQKIINNIVPTDTESDLIDKVTKVVPRNIAEQFVKRLEIFNAPNVKKILKTDEPDIKDIVKASLTAGAISQMFPFITLACSVGGAREYSGNLPYSANTRVHCKTSLRRDYSGDSEGFRDLCADLASAYSVYPMYVSTYLHLYPL